MLRLLELVGALERRCPHFTALPEHLRRIGSKLDAADVEGRRVLARELDALADELVGGAAILREIVRALVGPASGGPS